MTLVHSSHTPASTCCSTNHSEPRAPAACPDTPAGHQQIGAGLACHAQVAAASHDISALSSDADGTLDMS